MLLISISGTSTPNSDKVQKELKAAELNVMWSSVPGDRYISLDEFYSLAVDAIGESVESLSNQNLFYLAKAFSLANGQSLDFSKYVKMIANRILQLEAKSANADHSWLYLFDAMISTCEYRDNVGQSPFISYFSISKWVNNLLSMYADCEASNDLTLYAHAAAAMQTVLSMSDKGYDKFDDIETETLLLCRVYADRAVRHVLDEAYLGVGFPLWVSSDGKLKSSEHAMIGLYLETYFSNGGLEERPYTSIQLEATFGSFHLTDPRVGQPGEFFEYSYWIYRPNGEERDIKSDIHSLAAIAAANRISGRTRTTDYVILALQQGVYDASAAAVYAYASYLFG
jgi:hypothetical protein